mgnify:CR=1 FL=1|tara:strand:- start:2351 stop:2497 length:147 start_codon:yes stop_codon:yes gene_type:complete
MKDKKKYRLDKPVVRDLGDVKELVKGIGGGGGKEAGGQDGGFFPLEVS